MNFVCYFQYGRQNIENFRNSTRINFNISGSSENEMLPTSPQHQDDYDTHSNEQTLLQNGKPGYVPQSNGNGLSGNTVISRDTLKLLPEGEPVSNGKIKEQTADSNEAKGELQVHTITFEVHVAVLFFTLQTIKFTSIHFICLLHKFCRIIIMFSSLSISDLFL